jgi:DNA gyrase subunit A
MLFTYLGMAVRFDESNVRSMGRTARGVKGVTLRAENDYVVGCEVVGGDETILVVCENGFGKRSSVADFRQTNRGGVGVRSIVTSDRNGNVVGAVSITDNDGLLLMSSGGQTVRINMQQMRVMGRNTQGVKLVNLKESDTLVAMQKLEGGEAPEEKEDTSTEPVYAGVADGASISGDSEE